MKNNYKLILNKSTYSIKISKANLGPTKNVNKKGETMNKNIGIVYNIKNGVVFVRGLSPVKMGTMVDFTCTHTKGMVLTLKGDKVGCSVKYSVFNKYTRICYFFKDNIVLINLYSFLRQNFIIFAKKFKDLYFWKFDFGTQEALIISGFTTFTLYHYIINFLFYYNEIYL